MRVKFIFSTFLGAIISFGAICQNEVDDLYFNSKDRAKLNSKKISADIGKAQKQYNYSKASTPAQTKLNPTDSYSARNVNPEYSAQLNASSNNYNAESVEYFNSNFQPTGVNQSLSNCNCAGGSYYNPYYNQNSFSNPYYGNMGGFGNPYGSALGNPYNTFRPGLTMSMGYGWGSFNPGFFGGMGYGMGVGSFYNPYGYNSMWGGGYNPYYPTQVVVINGDPSGRQIVNGKRGSRSTTTNNTVDRTRTSIATSNYDRVTSRSGRSRSTQPEYYDRGWKRNPDVNPSRSYWNSNSSTTGVNNRSNYNWGNTSGNTGGRQRSTSFSSPSRGSFNNSGVSGGSRGGSSSGSRSSGGTRGRNN